MNLDQAIAKRVSCRKYQTKKLTETQLKEILNAARYAPSPKNRQPWRFVVLRDESKAAFLELLSNPISCDHSPAIYEKLNEFNSQKESYRIMGESDTIILVFNAYLSLEVLGKENALFDSTNIQAIGAAIQNMLLKATALGIGSLWICDVFASYQQICDQYYKNGQLIAAIALGYAAEEQTPIPKKPLHDLIINVPERQQTDNLIWVGPRESDIHDCKSIFSGSVTIFGSNCEGNISYCAENHVRIDHNVPNCVDNSFWIKGIRRIKRHCPDAKIMFYNNEFSFNLTEDLEQDVVCRNPRSLINMLCEKATARMAFSRLVPTVPFQELTYNEDIDLSTLFPDYPQLIFQENCSSGGYGTHVIEKNDVGCLAKFIGKHFMVSPYFKTSISVNVHLIISYESILHFPGSIQITRKIEGKLIYLGADYITFNKLSQVQRDAIRVQSDQIGKYLQSVGYRGVLGIDFLVTKDGSMFVEINTRFQASTPLLNKALKMQGLPSIQEMQVAAFSGGNLPDQACLNALSIPYSMLSYLEGTWDKSYDLLLNKKKIQELEEILADGFSPEVKTQKGAYFFKAIFNTNCTSISPDCTINLYENLLDIKDDFYDAIIRGEKLEIKISLLNQGVRISYQAEKRIQELGEIRNSVFSAVDLTIFDSFHINCPKGLKFNEFTPWKIDVNEQNELILFFHDFPISSVELDLKDAYCDYLVKTDVKFSNVCFWATDRLRIHHNLSCCMKVQEVGCRFCEVLPNNQSVSMEDILKTVDFYLEKANTFRHFLIGGGSEPREIEYKNILRIVEHIRRKSEKDIYVMSLPPKDLSILKAYYESGVTEIGFNIELFDQDAALCYMPGKGRIPRQEYFAALREAVKYWGNTGNVRSLMIVGLESEASLMQGVRQLCEIGVMPILSIFRPIPGTETEHIVPPSNRFLRTVYKKCSVICQEFGLNLGPKCTACQNNTLSLPF